MVNYKIVKYCRICKTRFVVMRDKSKVHLCEACLKRLAEAKAEAQEEAEINTKAESETKTEDAAETKKSE